MIYIFAVAQPFYKSVYIGNTLYISRRSHYCGIQLLLPPVLAVKRGYPHRQMNFDFLTGNS